MKIHRESLLNIPLVRSMLEDSSIRFSKRALDSSWLHEDLCPLVLTGFLPPRAEIYYPAESSFARWLKSPERSARAFNIEDQLIAEISVAVHDYLHCWAYQAIAHLIPKLGFGHRKITPTNFEDFVFCHMLTESAAIVGLDYWFFSQGDLNETVPIGALKYPFATRYNNHYDQEIKRYVPDLKIFSPSFYERITKVYLSGEFEGIDQRALKESPMILKWFTQEIVGSEGQRRTTRLWLTQLSGMSKLPTDDRLGAKVAFSKPWQRKLMKDLGELLWRKVTQRENIFLRPVAPRSRVWDAPAGQNWMDFRFLNLNSFGEDFWTRLKPDQILRSGEKYLYWQILSKYRLRDFRREELGLLKKLNDPRDLELLRFVLRGKKAVTQDQSEPSHLFIQN